MNVLQNDRPDTNCLHSAKLGSVWVPNQSPLGDSCSLLTHAMNAQQMLKGPKANDALRRNGDYEMRRTAVQEDGVHVTGLVASACHKRKVETGERPFRNSHIWSLERCFGASFRKREREREGPQVDPSTE